MSNTKPEDQAPTPPPVTNTSTQAMMSFKQGLILLLISSLIMSIQNIITKVILSKKVILGVWETGGFISPSFSNSILILVLRMSIVLPIMTFIVAPRIYKNSFRDLKDLLKPENKNRLIATLLSGVFLFSSFFTIYLSLGMIPAGVATTIFFIYPTITIMIMWIFFKETPGLTLVFAMITIYIGGFLTIPPANFTPRGDSNFMVGALSGAFSGIMFACYVIMIKQARMHPAPFSILSFAVVFLLGILIIPFLDYQVAEGNWPSVWIGSVCLAATTLGAYLLNNFGVPIVGPALAAVIGATGPAITTIMAFIFINEKLEINQVIGVFLVTLWVLGISVENLKKQQSAAGK